MAGYRVQGLGSGNGKIFRFVLLTLPFVLRRWPGCPTPWGGTEFIKRRRVPWPLVGHAMKEMNDLTQSPQRSRSLPCSSVVPLPPIAGAGTHPALYPYTGIRKKSTRRHHQIKPSISMRQSSLLHYFLVVLFHSFLSQFLIDFTCLYVL